MGMNKCQLHGHVGKDPELKTTTAGMPFCRFSLATTENWKDKNGEKKSKTEWHQIVAWGKQAETIAKLVGKGKEIIVIGKIEYQTVDKDGHKTTYTSIKLSEFDFCGKKGDGNDSYGMPDPEPSGYIPDGDSSDDVPSSGGSTASFDDSDIPF
jgi:single-strand DNA-binding protein